MKCGDDLLTPQPHFIMSDMLQLVVLQLHLAFHLNIEDREKAAPSPPTKTSPTSSLLLVEQTRKSTSGATQSLIVLHGKSLNLRNPRNLWIDVVNF
jgi:hypothetical protein